MYRWMAILAGCLLLAGCDDENDTSALSPGWLESTGRIDAMRIYDSDGDYVSINTGSRLNGSHTYDADTLLEGIHLAVDDGILILSDSTGAQYRLVPVTDKTEAEDER